MSKIVEILQSISMIQPFSCMLITEDFVSLKFFNLEGSSENFSHTLILAEILIKQSQML